MHSANYEWMRLADASHTRQLAAQEQRYDRLTGLYAVIAVVVALCVFAIALWAP